MQDVRCPGGVRPGQLNLLVIRRVIMGDIAVTVVDLALQAFGDLAGWRAAPRPRPEFSDRGMYDPPGRTG